MRDRPALKQTAEWKQTLVRGLVQGCAHSYHDRARDLRRRRRCPATNSTPSSSISLIQSRGDTRGDEHSTILLGVTRPTTKTHPNRGNLPETAEVVYSLSQPHSRQSSKQPSAPSSTILKTQGMFTRHIHGSRTEPVSQV